METIHPFCKMKKISDRKDSFLFVCLTALLSFVIASCNSTDNNSIPIKGNSSEEKKNAVLTSTYSTPIPIDSTPMIMYPLSFRVLKDNDSKLKRYSSGSDGGPYWNIAFYDSKDGHSSLLDSGRNLLINSFQKLQKIIVYDVTTTDYNGDGKLDQNDPSYLFISDLTGKNFKQITPDHLNVESFQTINNLDMLLIEVKSDTNKNKKFEDNDLLIPMIFNGNQAGTAEKTFSESFQTEITNSFKKLYGN